MFARNIGLGNRLFIDRPERCTRHAIEHKQESLLRRLSDDVDVAAIVPHGQKLWSRRQVVVPHIVMDGLEMPQALARLRIQRNQAVAEQIVAGPIAAIEIRPRSSEWNIGNASLFVDRHFAPVVNATGGFIKIRRPCVVSNFSWMWNRMEDPDQLTG